MSDLLQSRKFWAAIIALAVVLVAIPNAGASANLEANSDAIIGGVVLLMTYVITAGFDPGIGWKGLFASRKFYALLLGEVVMVLDAFGVVLPFSLSVEQIAMIAGTLGTYMIGVAAEPNPL